MTQEFCEDVLGDSCEVGPEIEIPTPSPEHPLAILGLAVELHYDTGDGGPPKRHEFDGGTTFVLASPPVEGGAQVVWLVGESLTVDGRGIDDPTED